MNIRLVLTLYVAAMIAIIIAVDLVFFQNRFWVRLAANAGIVLIFAVLYLVFLRRV